MWNSRSYQLVSEHSILSAQRYNKVAAAEEFLEKRALHSKPEWKEELDRIKQQLQQRMKTDRGCRWRRDHARCEELSETDFEIYLEMKLQWLQEYHVTAKSRKPEKKIKESEEGRDKIRETLERMVEILDSYLSNVAAKSSKSEERRETDESEKEERIEGSSGVPWNVIAKTEGDEIGGDLEPPQEQSKIKAPREEDSPSETPDGGAFSTELSPLIDLGEITTSCVTVLCDREVEEDSSSQATHSDGTMTATLLSNDLGKVCLSRETELCDGDEDSSEETTLKDSSLEASVPWTTCDFEKQFLSLATDECDLGARKQRTKPDGKVEGLVLCSGEEEAPVEEFTPGVSPATVTDSGEAMAELQCSHDLGVQRVREFSLSVVTRNRKEWEKKNWAEVDFSFISLGQAQVTVSKSAQTLIFTPTQFIINEVLQVKREVDPVVNSLGQTHQFIITPSIFTNSGGVLQVEKEMDQKKRNGYDWAQNPNLNFKASASVFGFVGTPKIEVNFSAAVVSFSNIREATMLYYFLKNTVDWRTIDMGGNLSISSILWSLCFKLWDPGGRLLTIVLVSSP